MSLPMAILAGGLGTRLRPKTETVPKNLIEVAGQPFVLHQLELLRRNQIAHILFCAGYLGEMLAELLGDGHHLGVQIDYSFDGPKLLGTAGALKKALPKLGEAFFVLYGDTYLEIDYQAVARAFIDSGKLGLMTVFRNAGNWDRSNVIFENNRIINYDKHNPTPEMNYIDYGLGLLRAEALAGIAPDTSYDLADLYRELVAQDQLAGFEVTRRFYEIGSLPGLAETESYLLRITDKQKENHEGHEEHED